MVFLLLQTAILADDAYVTLFPGRVRRCALYFYLERFHHVFISSLNCSWLCTRCLVTLGISLKFNSVFAHIPFGTVIVNLVGAFIIGLAVSFFSNSSITPNYKLFLVTGFCGALTTFSTFSVEVVELLQALKFEYAISSIAIHVVGSLIFTVLGMLTYQLATNH